MDSNQKKFRPQQLKGRSYNWQKRYPWSLKNYLQHVFSVLHYKGRHAPQPIQIKWSTACEIFEHKHRRIL